MRGSAQPDGRMPLYNTTQFGHMNVKIFITMATKIP